MTTAEKCSGKDVLTVSQARSLERRMKRRDRAKGKSRHGPIAEAYRCNTCGQWHVGRTKQ